MPIVAVVAIAVVGVACDKLQKITWYIVNNNKYIAQPDNSTPGTLCPDARVCHESFGLANCT